MECVVDFDFIEIPPEWRTPKSFGGSQKKILSHGLQKYSQKEDKVPNHLSLRRYSVDTWW